MCVLDPDTEVAEGLKMYLDKPELVAGWITPQAVMLKDGRLMTTVYLRAASGKLIPRSALALDVEGVLDGDKPHPESTDGLFIRFASGERYNPNGSDVNLAVYSEMTLEMEGLSYEC